MDLFKPTEKAFCNKIKPSSYEQSLENRVLSSDLYPSLIELLFSNFDHHYTLIDEKDKELYVMQRILEIASDIDENSDIYNSFNYLRNMNRSDVQQGLQKNNTVSALLYLSDLYKVSTVVYMESSKSKVITSDKQRQIFSILYTSEGKWMNLNSEPINFKQVDFSELSHCLTMDVDTKNVYKKYLPSISKYKSPELIDMANERGIPLIQDGKKKVKKVLYDEINTYELNKM